MDTVSKYNHAAERWDRKVLRLGYVNAYRQFLQNHVEPVRPVLDMGTGTGLFADAWIASGGSRDITLMDPSEAMLRVARSRFANASVCVDCIASTLEDYQPEHTFQTILAAHAIEHCDDPAAAIAKLARCLDETGKLILVVSKPHWCNWLIWLRFRHRWYAPETLRQWARKSGLSHITTHAFSVGPPSRTSFGYVFEKTALETLC